MSPGKLKSFPFLCCVICLVSCSASMHGFNPEKKYNKPVLQQDYTLFRNILEENHPSLYWYTTKDSLDYYFDYGYQHITDSMTELQFRTLLSYVISKINCGHTTVSLSRKFLRYYDTASFRQFPLSIKFWDDTAVVAANLNRRDSILSRGIILKKLNDRPFTFYRDSLFRYLSMDGYGLNHKYQTLSNRGNFGGWYKNVFGLSDYFKINYLAGSGVEKTVTIPVFDPRKDSMVRKEMSGFRKLSRRERNRMEIFSNRNIQIDTAGNTAYMTVNTFTGGNGLHRFFRQSFRVLEKRNIQNLVIDVRGNGGGNVSNSTLLTEYLINHRFKLADSLYAISKRSQHGKYIEHYLRNVLFMSFISRKRADGKYHFGYFERHYFRPKKKFHYDKQVYVIIGGNSFSATTLFANAIKNQSNVTIVGEETGGGSYGNTAWLIPEVTLPNTHLRFRLPKFRMIMNVNYPKTGRGVLPDVEVKPTTRSIRDAVDLKAEKVKELIRANALKESKGTAGKNSF